MPANQMDDLKLKKYNYRLKIAYDGTNYSGWQIQPHATSIQYLIQQALCTVLQEDITLIGSGRTDAGVHALEQVAHFHCNKHLITSRFLYSLNSLIPPDIRILDVEQVPLSFHAQYSAIGKVYYYQICLNPIVPPFQRLYVYKPYEKIDLEKLTEASRYFIGTHDFTSFANSPTEGSVSKNPIRTIHRLDIVETELGIRLEFEGNGFLYKMVRNIVGTLLEVCSGKRLTEQIPEIFCAKDRCKAGKTAAACGLFLVKALYPETN